MAFKRGARFKHKNNEIITALNERGYTANNLHTLLGCSRDNAYKWLLNPHKLTLGHCVAISWAISRPLGWVINSLLVIPAKSGNWLDEDYSPIDKIRELKG